MATTTPSLTLNPLHLPPPSHAKLHHLSSLLHLFSHRNRNQHRRSLWWRSFSLFRRELLHLTTSITEYTTTPTTTHLARARKLTADAALLATTEKRMTFWREILVPKWHFAFSQLVADGRFAVLGVVLMGVLGEVCKVTGITGGYEEMGEREVERVLEEFAGEEWGLDGRGGLSGREERMGGEDRGEVVGRREEDEEAEVVGRTYAAKAKGTTVEREAVVDSGWKKRSKEESAASSPAPRSVLKRPREKTTKNATPSLEPSKKKKKRKNGGDAIDDLFDF